MKQHLQPATSLAGDYRLYEYLLVLMIGLALGCSSKDEPTPSALATKAGVTDMITRFSAVAGWPSLLDGGVDYFTITTLQLQRACKRLGDRPLLVFVNLDDLFAETDSTFVAHFIDDYRWDYTIHYRLKCTRSQVDSLLSSPIDRYAPYAIVAEDISVVRPGFSLYALYQNGDEGGFEELVELTLDDSKAFIVTGRLLDYWLAQEWDELTSLMPEVMGY